MHVGLRSGQSLPISDLRLKPGQNNRVKVSLVYPADATPGHLLSVVPVQQLAMLQRRQEMQAAAERALAASKQRKVTPTTPPPSPMTPAAKQPTVIKPTTNRSPAQPQQPIAQPTVRPMLATPRRGASAMLPAMIMPGRINATLEQRYREAIRAQQEWLQRMQGR